MATMNILNRSSLSATVDALAEVLFFQQRAPDSQIEAAIKWIAERQDMPGAYARMFAPTERDYQGIRLFTGERVRSRVGVAHILGEECCRVLALLSAKDEPVRTSLMLAVEGLVGRLNEAERRGYGIGTYCCGTCSIAYWRNLAIKLLPRAEERLRLGLNEMRQYRKGNGQWRRFPFYYTCLALTEIGPDFAKAEMQYAAAYWRKNLNRMSAAENEPARRRAAVGRRLLEQCD